MHESSLHSSVLSPSGAKCSMKSINGRTDLVREKTLKSPMFFSSKIHPAAAVNELIQVPLHSKISYEKALKAEDVHAQEQPVKADLSVDN